MYENKNDVVDKNEVPRSIQSSNKISYGKLKPNTAVPVLGKISKESTNDENSNCTTKKTENMKTSDMSNEFTAVFIDSSGGGSFNIGEESPHSKLLPGSCFKTPETSPSHSIFQITPCNSGEVLQYVHQQKTKDDKAVKKKDAKFIHTSTENQAVNDVHAALLKGEPVPKHIISKAMNVGSDDSSAEYLE
ncbi:uncharacterized protein LOC126427151 [Schistocerca serialis cubense]|uniref:uncharacterized protein LOC126427151 n=1 Tax=Schistocerca serialis cubense TaxID=2023355 RepID=UPI00214DF6C8|nr:uncharacterized protein LOC126427151 [Schistocerca serialis cubense]